MGISSIFCRKTEVLASKFIEMAHKTKRSCDKLNGASGSLEMNKKRKTDSFQNIVDKIEEIPFVITADNENDDPLQLNDINNDCLRHIFEFLSLYDLIGMAEIDNQFIFAAAEAFSRCHREKRFVAVATSQPNHELFRFGSSRMCGPQAMAGIHHFGARIINLSANFDAFRSIAPANRYPIDMEIMKHCTDSLKTLEVRFCNGTHFENIDKPFEKVENLVFNCCTVGVKFAQLNKWFPNLVQLKLSSVRFVQPTSIEMPFEYLAELSIINDMDACISEQTIQKILCLNRQLKSLHLRCDYGTELLLTVMKYLKQLETLELWTPKDRFKDWPAEKKFSLKMLKTLILHASHDSTVLTKMPFVLENVNELRLNGFYQYHRLIIELIESGEQLNVLSLIPYQEQQSTSPNEHEALKRAILTRKHLDELELCVDEFIGSDLQRFIGEATQMKMLRLMTTNLTVLESLQWRNNNNQWSLPARGIEINFVDFNIHDDGMQFRIFHQLLLKRND